MGDTEKLGGYYEMPMAIGVRMAMDVMTVVARVAIVAMTIAVLMVLVAMTGPTTFLGGRSVRRASFDVDMGNVVLRMAVPQGGAKPRYESRVEQQRIRRIENTECSVPAQGLLPERFHLRLPNNGETDVGNATDDSESTQLGDANTTALAIDTRTAYALSDEREKAIRFAAPRSKIGYSPFCGKCALRPVAHRWPPSEARVALTVLPIRRT